MAYLPYKTGQYRLLIQIQTLKISSVAFMTKDIILLEKFYPAIKPNPTIHFLHSIIINSALNTGA